MIKRKAELGLFLFFRSCLSFRDVADDLGILGNDDLAVLALEILRNLGDDLIAYLNLFRVDSLVELYGNDAAGSETLRLAGLCGRALSLCWW